MDTFGLLGVSWRLMPVISRGSSREQTEPNAAGSLAPERQLAAKLGAFNWMKVDRPRRATSTSDRSITPEKGGNSKELKD
jgi:hypothetical protein